MAVGSSFDQWQKDVFFPAAEEVQESADTMESVYRMWIRSSRDGFNPETSEYLFRELQAALGTAKWQLEEFERAVKLSHESCLCGDNTITRHSHFVAAIESQILRVEKELSDSLSVDGKGSLRWVQLDEEERDDLAAFLSGAPQIGQGRKPRDADGKKPLSRLMNSSDCMMGFRDTVTVNSDERYIVQVSAKESFSRREQDTSMETEELNEHTISMSSQDIGSWKIVIADQEDTDKRLAETRPGMPNHASNLRSLIRISQLSTKLKWFRNSFWKAKDEEHLQLQHNLVNYLDLKGVARFTKGINQLTDRSRNFFNSCKEKSSSVQPLVGRVGGFQKHLQGSKYCMQFSRSLLVTFLVMLSIILVVPFVLYSS